ncbi:MAG: selenium-binding family protein [Acidobacteriota bacterium]|nr:selenium-binding family protein [Acidobacteriota bacterium]
MKLTCVILAALAAIAPLASAAMKDGDYLFVWAGDADRADEDFLSVIDADPSSPRYGHIVTTLAAGAKGTFPHHTDHEMPRDGVLWANGFGSGQTFRFDLRNPRQPRLLGAFVVRSPFMHPHSYARLADGRTLATLQMRGHGNAEPGALVELDAEGKLLRTADAADAAIDPYIRPYSLAVLPALDRIVTTSADMHAKQPSRVVQVWRLSDLSRVATVVLPDGPKGGEGVDPAEPRVLSDGRTVLVSTFSCGLYRLDALEGDAPSATFVHAFTGDGCALPVVASNYWVQTVPRERALVSVDVSDPSRPREAGRLTLGSTEAPHWISLDPTGTRIVISGGDGTLSRRVLVATIDPMTGALALDPRFRDPGAAAAGVSFGRTTWPHGPTGPAVPHGAVFSRAGGS